MAVRSAIPHMLELAMAWHHRFPVWVDITDHGNGMAALSAGDGPPSPLAGVFIIVSDVLRPPYIVDSARFLQPPLQTLR